MRKQRVWAIVGQKGGDGKSTVAFGLSDYLAKHGRKTALLDMDRPQFSSVLLGKLGDKPLRFDLIRCQQMRDVHKRSEGYEAIVFDGAPHASSDTLTLCGFADLVVIPTRTFTINLKPALDLASELIANGIEQNKIIFLVSQALSDAEARDARATIEEHGFRVAAEDLRMYLAYGKAGDAGRSVLEVTYPTLRERAERVFAELASV